jgi:hypothetical protein
MSAEFNMWNPLYALAPFLLLMVSVPLAMFAVVTTSIAVSLLACRAAIVYVQLAVAILGAWIDPTPPKAFPALHPSPPTLSPGQTSPNRQRNHRSSNASSFSSQDTIVPSTKVSRLPNRPNPTLFGPSEITRDFEGVGGWRTPGDDDEEALWMGINSRLQLPADTTARRHQRSLTGGASPGQRWSWSPEAFRMSPVQSRARTPVRLAAEGGGGYFPPQPMGGARPLSVASEPSKNHKRRKSASSISSTASGVNMTGKGTG